MVTSKERGYSLALIGLTECLRAGLDERTYASCPTYSSPDTISPTSKASDDSTTPYSMLQPQSDRHKLRQTQRFAQRRGSCRSCIGYRMNSDILSHKINLILTSSLLRISSIYALSSNEPNSSSGRDARRPHRLACVQGCILCE